VWLLAGILLLAAAVHFSSLANGFIAFDDPTVVVDNPYIRGLSLANLAYWFTKPVQYMYMPLALLSFAVDYQLGELDPWIYHLDNFVLHLGCVALVFWVFLLLTRRSRVALLVALLFAVHPVNVDTVASVAARTNLLATLFSLGALGCYGLYLEKDRRLRYLALAFLSFLLALCAKSSAVVLPLTLLLWDYLRDRRWDRRLILEKLPFFALALGFGVLALAMRTDDVLPPVHYGPLDRGLVFLYALASYCVRLLFPFRLSMAYAYPVEHGPWLPLPYYLAPVLLALIGWGLHALGVSRKVLVFGLGFFVLNIALSQSVLLIDSFAANRYAYLPYLGFLLILVDLGERAWSATSGRWRSWLRTAAVGGAVILVAGFSLLTHARNAVWRDSMTLFDDVIRKQPGIAWAHGTRGLVELHAQDLEAARRDLDESLRLDPSYTPSLSYRGAVNLLSRDYPAALADLSRALSIDPRISGAYRDRGKVKMALQDEPGALADFDRAVELDPRSQARFARGLLKHRRGDDRGALADLDVVIASSPEDAEALLLRGMVKTGLNDHAAACADIARARGLGYPLPDGKTPDGEPLPGCP
jgi:tetratricopeptide (TPR) repeat protein